MNTDEHGSAEKYDINGIEVNCEIKSFRPFFVKSEISDFCGYRNLSIIDQSSLQKIAYSVNVKSTVTILNSLTY